MGSSTVQQKVDEKHGEERLWGKYWIEGGLEVVHRNDITELNRDRLGLFKMSVDKVVKRSKEGQNGARRVYIDGVKCHWIDNDRKYQTGTFHTNELVPYHVAIKGVDVVNKWIVRELK